MSPKALFYEIIFSSFRFLFSTTISISFLSIFILELIMIINYIYINDTILSNTIPLLLSLINNPIP